MDESPKISAEAIIDDVFKKILSMMPSALNNDSKENVRDTDCVENEEGNTQKKNAVGEPGFLSGEEKIILKEAAESTDQRLQTIAQIALKLINHNQEDCCDVAIQLVMQPRHTNQYQTIFGGIILSYIDQAAFVEASKHGIHRWVTASMDKVDFKKPIKVGDTVRFSTKTIRKGTSSVTIEVNVEAHRGDTHETVEVTHATVTMVSVGPDGKPIPFTSPPTAHYRG